MSVKRMPDGEDLNIEPNADLSHKVLDNADLTGSDITGLTQDVNAFKNNGGSVA